MKKLMLGVLLLCCSDLRGFHLVSATDEHLQWTAKKMQSFGVSKMIVAHCTGIDSLYTIRKLLKSD